MPKGRTPTRMTVVERKGNECFGRNAIECLICVGTPENPGNAFASISLGGPGATSSTPEDVRATARLLKSAPELLAALKGAQSALRKALPFLPADKEALYVGEWLEEVNEAIAIAETE